MCNSFNLGNNPWKFRATGHTWYSNIPFSTIESICQQLTIPIICMYTCHLRVAAVILVIPHALSLDRSTILNKTRITKALNMCLGGYYIKKRLHVMKSCKEMSDVVERKQKRWQNPTDQLQGYKYFIWKLACWGGPKHYPFTRWKKKPTAESMFF